MEITLQKINASFHELDKLDASRASLNILLPNISGHRSHNIEFYIDDKDDHSDRKPYVNFFLNKNQALYLANFLLAFVKEQDIDINAED